VTGVAPQKRSWRGPVVFAVKFGLAALLLTWLWRSGKLDIGALRTLGGSPRLLAANFATWLLCSAFLTTLRWRTLLSSVGAKLPFLRALALQLMGLFFNVVIPGNIGGDVLKSVYVTRREPDERHTSIYLIVFVERILGLMGLGLMTLLAVAVRGVALWAQPELHTALLTSTIVALGMVFGPIGVAIAFLRLKPQLAAFAARLPRLKGIVDKLFFAAELLRQSPRKLGLALLYSLLNNSIAMLYFFYLARSFSSATVELGTIATIYPLGLLTVVLPISPGGFGVGHIAFDNLFKLVGLTGGATVFNVFLIGQVVPCTIGVVPYLLLGRGKPDLRK
jgi:glycosyltransferase 2 family protein